MLAGTREAGVRTYIPERKQPGLRNWRGKEAQRQAVYANRRRVGGDYGKRLLNEAWRVGGTELRALLRHGRNAANASAENTTTSSSAS